MRRVVVTGVGAVTPLGRDIASTWEGLTAGRSGIGPVTRFDAADFRGQVAGEVKDWDPAVALEGLVPNKEQRHLDRNVQFAVAAAAEAVGRARLAIDEANAPRVGVIWGSALGGIELLTEQIDTLRERGVRRVSPFFLPHVIVDAASGQIAIALGAKGPNFAVVSACATGGGAIGEAYETVAAGKADAIIAGGSEAVIVPIVFAGFTAMRALGTPRDGEGPETASRPFDATRNGFVVAEGAGAVVVEALDHALARDATILAEVAGYATSGDAYHMAAQAEGGAGAVRAMRDALQRAGLEPEAVDYINAHGSSTPMNDASETLAIKEVFGDHAYKLAVSSTKSMTGHMMGATGAVEAIACCLALAEGVIPPTINLVQPDPACDLDYVPGRARRTPIRVALSNTMGLGGHNSSLVLKRWDG